MSVTQTVEIPPSRWLNIQVPLEVPTGQVVLTWQSPLEKPANIEPNKEREFGCLKGQIWMADDFDAPLEDFRDYM